MLCLLLFLYPLLLYFKLAAPILHSRQNDPDGNACLQQEPAADWKTILKTVRKTLSMSLIEVILAKALNESPAIAADTCHENPPHPTQIIQYIHENLDNVTLDTLSDNFGYHPRYLSKIIKNLTGMSLKQFLTSERINKAKTMLHETDSKIGEIGEKCGFNSSVSFSRRFLFSRNRTVAFFISGGAAS